MRINLYLRSVAPELFGENILTELLIKNQVTRRIIPMLYLY